MKLTDKQIKAAQPADKPYKLADGKGMFLQVNKNGSKYWRLKYRFNSKEQLLSLGVYPETTLKQARSKCDEARQLLADGINPSTHKQDKATASARASENSFEAITREWLEVHAQKVSPLHIKKITSALERFLLPSLGRTPITEIDTPTILEPLRKLESTGKLETVQRVKRTAGQIFTYAISTGRATNNPVLALSRGVLKTPKQQHRAAITEPAELGRLMLAIDNYSNYGNFVVESALKCTALWLLRQGELRFLEWHQVNWAEKRIELIASKTNLPHIIPLATQSIEILEQLQAITGKGKYIFQSLNKAGRPISENTTNEALRNLGIDKHTHCAHGFRATARTLLDETLKFRVEIVEMQLAHAVKDIHGRAYNRTQFLEERAAMMQRWANYLDELKQQAQAGNVLTVNFNRTAS